jgi:Cu-processing system ATP-binding protein
MIAVSDLRKTFGSFVALDGVSFDLRAGETLALLGPNGSGKSTTLKCIAGLVMPTSGKITVEGFDISKEPIQARQRMSYLPQRVAFHDHLTGREVMEFFCKLRRLPLSRIQQLLGQSDFDFNGFAQRRVGEFSGGMLQRLGLAVACLPDAPILLLDEPTVSLDPEGAVQFRQFLRYWKSAGKTILFSSHMLADVEDLADRVAIMVQGKLVALQTIEELKKEATESNLEKIYIRYIHSNG